MLEDSDWDVDEAYDRFANGNGGRSSSSSISSSSSASSSSSSSSSSSISSVTSSSLNRRVNSGSLGSSNSNNYNSNTSNSSSSSGSSSSSSSSSNSGINREVGIIDLVLRPIRFLFKTTPHHIDPKLDTRKFLSEFDSSYSPQHPVLHDSSFQSAVATAFSASKFLLIYLHSPLHEDTERFCQQVFCSSTLSSFVNNANIVTWAGKVWDPEAYKLSSELRVSCFPYLALLVCYSNRQFEVAVPIQGYTDEQALTEKLQSAMTQFTPVITRVRTENTRFQESARLREQQDREYREAEERDRLERLRKQEEEEELARLEVEERNRGELEAAMELSKKLTKDSEILKKRQNLPPEPDASMSEAATIRFQLPTGTKILRRFHKEDTVQTLYDYLSVHFADTKSEVNNFSVSTHFPKVELTDMTASIDTVGLFPRGMLFVQNLDT